ncbi:MAG: hypothetical protein P1V34_15160 [Alphaproteobacteria bacterium]|nr:hypothetical protein [Alphaproteobacteria bacterium]
MTLGRLTLARIVFIALLGLTSLGLIGGASAATAQTFIEGSEDLPLAPMLTPVADGSVIFDSPSGRIVEAIAYGSTSREVVKEFYAKTLPELGWKSLDSTHYHREEERLVIDFFGNDGALNVRFTLVPE